MPGSSRQTLPATDPFYESEISNRPLTQSRHPGRVLGARVNGRYITSYLGLRVDKVYVADTNVCRLT